MNFNEEMERELSDLHLGGRVVDIRPEDKGTPKDWAILESKIALRMFENERGASHNPYCLPLD